MDYESKSEVEIERVSSHRRGKSFPNTSDRSQLITYNVHNLLHKIRAGLHNLPRHVALVRSNTLKAKEAIPKKFARSDNICIRIERIRVPTAMSLSKYPFGEIRRPTTN